MKPPAISEDARQLVHIAVGSCALLLRWLTWFEATLLAASAVAFNLSVLHRVGGARLFRPDEHGRWRIKSGIVLYPLSVLGLLLVFPARLDIVAGAWGVLAAGDGMATLIGRHLPLRPLPWNRHKSLGGLLAFIVFGAAAAVALLWWCAGRVTPPAFWWFPLVAGVTAAVVAAAVETIPIGLDDNVSVAASAGAVMWSLAIVSDDLVVQALSSVVAALPAAVAANGAVAAAGYAARTVSLSGALAGVVLGVVIYVSTGWQGWMLLLATFALAVIASRLGLAQKQALRIEEERGGRRGAGNALANTGVAAAAGLIGMVSVLQPQALIAFAAALTAGGSDTVASEVGKAYGRRTFLATTLARVPPGTPGAMSLEGTAAGLISALLLAFAASWLGIVGPEAILPIVAGATAGAFVESLLAATLEHRGVVNNDVLNLLNTATAAFVAVRIGALG